MGVAPQVASREVLPGLDGDVLRDYLSARLGESSLILDSVRLAGQGMSDDTILVEASAEGRKHSLALRRYRTNAMLRELTDPQRHYRTLVALAQTDIPAPRALWFDADSPIGGTVFGMDRLPGSAPIPWSTAGKEFLRAAGEGPLGQRFASLLAEIHAVDWAGLGLGNRPAPSADDLCVRAIDHLASAFAEFRTGPEPVFADAIGWLRANRPADRETTLVHGDYRTGNLLFADGEVSGILDWELAQPGDPMQDLAWVLADSNRVGSDLACYILPPDTFIELYEKYSGRSVDRNAVRFWQVYYQVFNALAWLNAEHRVISGGTRDLRMLRWTYTLPVMRRYMLRAIEAAS